MSAAEPTFAGRLGAIFGFDPVMRKECTGLSRRWTMYVFRCAYVLILILVIWTLWLDYRRHVNLDASIYARMGREFFNLFTAWQFGLLALGGIAWTADLIAKEVRGNTLGVLTATPLSPMSIVLGKWKSSLGYLSIVILAGLPILALGIALGAVEPLDLARVTVLTLSMAMMCAAFGLFVSTLSTASFTCLLGGIAGMVILILCPVFLSFQTRDPWPISAAAWVHPVYALAATTSGGRIFGGGADTWSWLTSFCSVVAFSYLMLVFAARRLTTLSRRVPRPPLARRIFEGLDRYFANHPLGVPIWRSRSNVWDWNPLLWKELRFRMTGRLHYTIRILVLLLLVGAALISIVGEGLVRSEFHLVAYTLLTVLVLLASMGAGATAFAREKELHQWDMLRTIPVDAPSMVGAKLAGGFVSLLPFAALYAMGGLLIIVMSGARGYSYSYRDEGYAWTLILSTVSFSMFLVSLGLYLSARLDTTKKAFSGTLAVALIILILVPILLSFMEASRPTERFILAVTNPFFHVRALAGMWGRDDLFAQGTVGHVLIYSAMSAILLRLCVARIRKA